MADVWCAEDLQLGRRVALKLLHRRFAEDQDFVERFRREASAAAGLQHPNVVAVYDRGEWDGTYYIAMEFLEGETLKDLIVREAPLEADRAIDFAIQILRASRFAHKRGIIHRDLKPHNVMVDAEGRAKVTDFGIARAGASDMTETGSILGTAQYLSPEQAQGHAVTGASDLYAIGIILYEMVTGHVPFDGDSAVTIALKQVSEPPVPPTHLNPAVTPDLENVIGRALEKEPTARYADADEFIAALEAVRGGGAFDGGETSAFAPVGAAYAPLDDEGRSGGCGACSPRCSSRPRSSPRSCSPARTPVRSRASPAPTSPPPRGACATTASSPWSSACATCSRATASSPRTRVRASSSRSATR